MLVSRKRYKLLESENERLKREIRQTYDDNKIHVDKITDLEKKIVDLEKEKETTEIYLESAIAELEKKTEELENENKDLKIKRSSTEIMKKQILNMCLYRDKKGKRVRTKDGEVLVNEKISGVKVWDLVNLM